MSRYVKIALALLLALFLLLSSILPVFAAPVASESLPQGSVTAYPLSRDILLRRVKEASAAGEVRYATFYNVDRVSTGALREAVKYPNETGGKVLCRFDTVVDDIVLARATVNPNLIKAGEGQTVSFLLDPRDTAVRAVREKFERFWDKPVAALRCSQPEFGFPVAISARLELGAMNPDSLAVYSYDVPTNTYQAIADAGCTVDEDGIVHLLTTKGGYLLLTEQ